MPGWGALMAITLASAQEGPVEAPAPEPGSVEAAPEAAPPTWEQRLAAAKEAYFQGGHDEALALLRELVSTAEAEGVAAPLAQEAGLYLGEVLYKSGDQAAAWDVFHGLLTADPDLTISPYHHPTEVIAWFELVRRQVQQDLAAKDPDPPPPPPPIGRTPLWVYLPLGLGDFMQGELGAGVGWGAAQLGAGALSIGMYRWIDAHNDANQPAGWDADRVNALRFRVQFPATFAFYALWAGGALDARARWRRHQAEVVLLPAPQGLVLHARF